MCCVTTLLLSSMQYVLVNLVLEYFASGLGWLAGTYARCFLSRHTVHGRSGCINKSQGVHFSAHGVLKLCLVKLPIIHQTILSSDRSRQPMLHVATYRTSVALFIWLRPADHSHRQVHTTLPGLACRFCCLTPSSSQFFSDSTSPRLCCLLLSLKITR